MKDLIIAILQVLGIFVFMVIVLAPIAYVAGSTQCKAEWANSALAYNYEFFAGCLVEQENGQWVPAKYLRGAL